MEREERGRAGGDTRGCGLLGCLGAMFLLAGCATRPGYAPVALPGPETPGLSAKWHGVVIRDEPVGGILAMDLPSRTVRTIKPASVLGLDQLAGPDRNGWIVYCYTSGYNSAATTQVRTFWAIRVDGAGDHALFRRTEPIAFDAMGGQMALSPVGHHLAFVTDLSGVQMTKPDAWLESGNLQVWNISTKAGGSVGITARDSALSWFPNGRRLAYAALVPNRWAGSLAASPDGFGKSWDRWPRVPAAHILDVKSGKVRFVCIGDDPVVSLDGKAVLVRDYDSRLRMVNVATGAWRPVQLPGQAWSYSKSVIAFKGNSFLYWAVPTAGTAPKATKNNSPLVGPKWMLGLKVADVSTGGYETVWQDLDPRRDVDFGPPPPVQR
jgi:hypothetical protein